MIHAQLSDDYDIHVGCKRVTRLMQADSFGRRDSAQIHCDHNERCARDAANGFGPTALVLAAIKLAIMMQGPKDVIHHSDHSCQYTSYAFGKRCREAGLVPCMGSVGDAYDNAMGESFFATLEREVLDRRGFKTQAEAKLVIFDWLEGWYNPYRRHSALGYRSPANYERLALE